MAAKEIICILCIGVGTPEIRSDKCDLAHQVIEGPNRKHFLLKRSDGRGAHNLRDLMKRENAKCKRERGELK